MLQTIALPPSFPVETLGKMQRVVLANTPDESYIRRCRVWASRFHAQRIPILWVSPGGLFG